MAHMGPGEGPSGAIACSLSTDGRSAEQVTSTGSAFTINDCLKVR